MSRIPLYVCTLSAVSMAVLFVAAVSTAGQGQGRYAVCQASPAELQCRL